MLFNSLDFLIFFSAIFIIYWGLPRKPQNHLLLFSSYFFYGYWDWKFLSLILFSTAVDFFSSQLIHQRQLSTQKHSLTPRFFLWLSITTNLSLLLVFKFYGFFINELKDILPDFLGKDPIIFSFVIPVGISFYTFQTMSYTIDVYKKRIKPSPSFFDFALYVSFFPQLLAGPIERAGKMLPQFEKDRMFDPQFFQFGFFLIIWGLFQKVVVADNLIGPIAIHYGSPRVTSPSRELLTNYAAAIRIYCDFAGYSNIAKGLGALLGFQLSTNFKNPFFAHNPSQFWERWHITLTGWFKMYLFYPLAQRLRRFGRFGLIISLLVTMTLAGAWHGANWTFFVWGFVHGLAILIYHIGKKPISKLPGFLKAFLMFNVFGFLGQFFLIPKLSDFHIHWQSYFMPWHWQETDLLLRLLVFALPMFFIEWLHEKHGTEEFLFKDRKTLRWAFGILLYIFILTSGVEGAHEYIYFQF